MAPNIYKHINKIELYNNQPGTTVRTNVSVTNTKGPLMRRNFPKSPQSKFPSETLILTSPNPGHADRYQLNTDKTDLLYQNILPKYQQC